MPNLTDTHLVIYSETTAAVAAAAGDHKTANDSDYCARNDQALIEKAESDGHTLILLPEWRWEEHRAAAKIRNWASWEEFYGGDCDSGFWRA